VAWPSRAHRTHNLHSTCKIVPRRDLAQPPDDDEASPARRLSPVITSTAGDALGPDAYCGWWKIGLRVADTVAANVSGCECSHDQN
jgi:hypothetical protein